MTGLAILGFFLIILSAFMLGKRSGDTDSNSPYEHTYRVHEVFFKAPDFTLTERNNEPFSNQELKGKTWIAGIIFTNCPGPCIDVTRSLRDLRDAIPEDKMSFVLFSIDPKRDTPEVMTAFAQRFNIDTPRWKFLTGDQEKVHHMARDGFKLAVMETPDDKDSGGFIHSTRLALIDDQGYIRRYFDSNDPQLAERIKQALSEIQ